MLENKRRDNFTKIVTKQLHENIRKFCTFQVIINTRFVSEEICIVIGQSELNQSFRDIRVISSHCNLNGSSE